MDTFFLLAAIIGGTFLLIQFAMTLLGLGGGDHGADAGGDSGLDVGSHDFSGDASGGHHTHGGDSSSHPQNGSSHQSSSDQPSDQHDTVGIFKIISLQTLVAAVAFFGIAGKAARSANVEPLPSLVIALGVGFAAMYGVYHLIRGLHRFNADGTLQIARAVGQTGTVYLSIPAASGGVGKIHINVQNRLTELLASTPGERLPAGAKVRVVAVLGPETVQVEREV